METMRYSGFHYPREIYADNREFYRRCLENPREAIRVGITEKMAKKHLDLSERFPPGIEHSRLVSHYVNIYSIEDPVWVKKGRLLVPKGRVKKIDSLDIGAEVEKICEKELSMEEKLEEQTIDLGDGTVLKGTRIRKSSCPGFIVKRTMPNNYLKITFDASLYEEKRSFFYSFKIKTESMTPSHLNEFHMRQYVTIDGQKVSESTEAAKPVFASFNGKDPSEFHHMSYNSRGK